MGLRKLDDLLVEPMARAICAVEFDGDVDSWDRLPADDSERKVWRREHGYEGLCVKSEYRSAARAAIAAQRATLKSAGLFIGPEVATPEMENAMALRGAGRSSIQWAVAVAEWQRGGVA